MGSFPGKRRFLGLKESINDERTALRGSSRTGAGRRATHHRGATVDRNASRIRKKDTTAKGDPFRINSAMSVAQSSAIRTCAHLAFTRPIDRDPRQQRIVRGES